jgi:hypothetical protein
MLQLRARSFALRDGFADLLGGMRATEEAQDFSPTTSRAAEMSRSLGIIDAEFVDAPAPEQGDDAPPPSHEAAEATQGEPSTLGVFAPIGESIDLWCIENGHEPPTTAAMLEAIGRLAAKVKYGTLDELAADESKLAIFIAKARASSVKWGEYLD